MSTNNIGFYEDLTKIIFELSSNTHLISSADVLTDLCLYFLHRLETDFFLTKLTPCITNFHDIIET